MTPAGSSPEQGSRDSRNNEGLLLRLLQRFQTPSRRADESLLPVGRRSGLGARSIEPYLDPARNTRPGPLE